MRAGAVPAPPAATMPTAPDCRMNRPRQAKPRLAARPRALAACGLIAAALLAGCGGSGGGGSASAAPAALSPMAALGAKLFADPSLSASGQLACASCHVPALAHAGSTATVSGGANLDRPGTRNAPSLRYLDFTPAFAAGGDGASGGFDRDGRAQTLAEQARAPILSANEMANASPADFAARLQQASYAAEFRAAFGQDVFANAEQVVDRATLALERYQLEDSEFHAYSSKYDAFLAGKASLADAELRGLALFNNPQKGNCAACHPSGRGADGSAPLFTDFSYDNLGVPRNPDIAANADASYYDLGLCGPARTDLKAARPDLCGAFKVPTLRNIALTAPYFHNGRFATLKEALQFYVQRDTNPERWYPLNADGSVDKFDDLPRPAAGEYDYRRNVNTSEVPYDRKAGEAPRLSDAEIDDLIAFLNTLTDGYTP